MRNISLGLPKEQSDLSLFGYVLQYPLILLIDKEGLTRLYKSLCML